MVECLYLNNLSSESVGGQKVQINRKVNDNEIFSLIP